MFGDRFEYTDELFQDILPRLHDVFALQGRFSFLVSISVEDATLSRFSNDDISRLTTANIDAF